MTTNQFNSYLNQNQPSETLINTLDYLGISLEKFKQMSDSQIRQLVKKYSDALDNGLVSQSKPIIHDGSDLGYGYKQKIGEYPYNDKGSFSRYFSLNNWWQERIKKLPDEVKKVFPFLIIPKANSGEKQKGLDGFEEKQWIDGSKGDKPQNDSAVYRKNFHPTVKPLDLMSYLITLGSRDNDLVFDPFIGSGTTAIACRLLNRNFIGFEINKEYFKIAEARLSEYINQKKLSEVI